MSKNLRALSICLIILFVFFCGIVLVPEIFLSGKTKDYPRWYWVGTRFLSGESIYDDFYFLYPPFAAMFYALPTPLGKIGHYFTLVVISMAAYLTVIHLTAKDLGRRAELTPFQTLLPILLTLTFLSENFDLGQPNIILLALMVAGFFMLKQGRELVAGVCFGTAIAIKFFPITVLPYLLWRRHWIASATLIISVATLTFLAPAPIRGFEKNLAEIQQWYDGMQGSEDGFGQRSKQNWSWKNQSIIALTHRLTRELDYRAVDRNAEPEFMNVIDVDYKTANLITLCVAGLIGFGFISVIPSQRRRTHETDTIEVAILLCLMTLASPLARSYYFIWLYVPVAVLVHYAALNPVQEIRKVATISLVTAILVGIFALPFFPKFFQAAGNLVMMTAVLIAGLAVILRGVLDREKHHTM